jgi:hypothetical protein
MASNEKVYFIETDDLAKLDRLADRMMGGTDQERDFGHTLWYVLDRVRKNELDASVLK